jgi:hypothetical protein
MDGKRKVVGGSMKNEFETAIATERGWSIRPIAGLGWLVE